MKILAVDTSTRFLCLGVCRQEGLYEYKIEAATKLSAWLMPAIKRVLEALGEGLRDIDYFACGIGPGSFTGVRVGIATIKGLAWSMNKPVAGISTLDILARNAPQDKGLVAPVIDAKRGLVYSAIYSASGDNLKRVSPYMLLSPEETVKKIKAKAGKRGGKRVTILGDGLAVCRQAVSEGIGTAVILDKDYWYPEARNIIACAKENIRHRLTDTAFGVKPVYLYPKECQIRKTKTL
ncbi:MAG: tRNA (adenosine(37)-N6)-threonylcarbamoyltransferase complex dimerization subunit type 1 TsaB [Candidatus Omnitrophica bacterium]|nr:tRNA (adenosine(37)-N6)-threonylcarbamoyltransferase complex dimerization subunit type 1 TsaB [Candidatus Omnitrophota bacterium]